MQFLVHLNIFLIFFFKVRKINSAEDNNPTGGVEDRKKFRSCTVDYTMKLFELETGLGVERILVARVKVVVGRIV